MEYARIELRAEPYKHFDVDISRIYSELGESRLNMVQSAILGLLDVLLFRKVIPLRNIKIVMLNVEFDPINSSMIAFRHAGRDAGKKIIELAG